MHGKNWAAKKVLGLTESHSNVVVSGLRGEENVRTLRENGFFVVFLDSAIGKCAERISNRDRISHEHAMAYLEKEDGFFRFDRMKHESSYVLDVDSLSRKAIERAVTNICMTTSRKNRHAQLSAPSCQRCGMPNLSAIQGAAHSDEVECQVCKQIVETDIDQSSQQALEAIMDEIGPRGNSTATLGFSGGKDSTAAFIYLKQRGVRFSTFTVNMGYYPFTSFARAAEYSKKFDVDHYVVDGRNFIHANVRDAYALTADLYDKIREGDVSASALYNLYVESRRHYRSHDHFRMPYPRVCVLCRKSVIKSYYEHAKLVGAKYVVLGINEWANLAGAEVGGGVKCVGVRRLSPEGHDRAVYVVHLPFLLGATLSKNLKLLEDYGWTQPHGEDLVESNSNSCLLAKSTEKLFIDALGFHPDSTRLSREVAVGFLSRSEAAHALSQVADLPWTPREVLQHAEIL
jgi:hypothetical protein